MQAGKLRHRITIQQKSTSLSDAGEQVESWSTFASRLAAMEAASGTERTAEDRQQATATDVFTIRHTPGVTSAMRIQARSRTWQILAVLPDRTDASFQKIHAVETV